MLKITEHFEYYNRNRNHISTFQTVNEWNTYFEMAVAEDEILFNDCPKSHCAHVQLQKTADDKYCCNIKSSYYIGLDRFPKLGLDVYISPKINTINQRLDYIKILLEALSEPENFEHLKGLMQAKFDNNWIWINREEVPILTPFLLAQFLTVVKSLVKKGLKKSYYTRTDNLRNRIKGKLLVGPQIKNNVLKNRLLDNFCQFQEFGVDSEVNQFLKFVLSKVAHYMDLYGHNTDIYKNLKSHLDYCEGGFHHISDTQFRQFKYKEVNAFYKHYNIAIQLGNQILRLEDYNIAREANISHEVPHPPFWIDMSKLFELYVFKLLKEKYPGENELRYHETFNRQEPDFILNTRSGVQAIVDCKYKPRYATGNPNIEDARQLSGYTRLNKIYQYFELDHNELIPAYIIYPANLDKLNITEVAPVDSFETQEQPESSAILNPPSCRISTTYKMMYMEEVYLPTDNHPNPLQI